jgi:PadR family transcriptional regulator, regulatory protein PadR
MDSDNPPLRRLKNKTTVEVLWVYILSLMRKEPLYAYEIGEKIKVKFGFEIGDVTAYMVLYRLELEGYVKTEWKAVENRQRKYYTITPEGERLADLGKDYLKELIERI